MDCPYIPDLKYSDFAQRLRANIGDKRVPLSGSVELTFRCNLRCKHCYLDSVHDGMPGQKELSAAEFDNIFAQIADEGTLWLLLTGGEPLVRSDFREIYASAKRRGFILTLFTNGTLLTPEMADFLTDWRPAKIEITLYGYTQGTYERVTGIPGSHARCMRGIELLMERGLPLRLKSVLMTLNEHELEEMRAFAERLGVDYRFDTMLNGGVGGDLAPTYVRLSPEEIVRLDREDPKRLAAWQEFVETQLRKPPDPSMVFFCGAGMRTFHIDPYGKLSVCMIARAEEYDLRMGTFAEGWRGFLRDVRFQAEREQSPCNRCDLLALCGICPGWSYLEHGRYGEPIAFLGRVAALRAEWLDLASHTECELCPAEFSLG